jgi:hypothetical protein
MRKKSNCNGKEDCSVGRGKVMLLLLGCRKILMHLISACNTNKKTFTLATSNR